MKKIMKLAILVAVLLEVTMAANPPRDMADVIGRSINSSSGSWFAKFGHVALYNSSNRQALEVTNHRGNVVRYVELKTMTRPETGLRHYWGARYGKGSTSQHYRALSYGYSQKSYNTKYTFSPYYTEAKWVYKYRWYPRKFRWIKKWYKQNAKFRCDSFVNFCYKKATGRSLIKYTWATTSNRVFKALPRKR